MHHLLALSNLRPQPRQRLHLLLLHRHPTALSRIRLLLRCLLLHGRHKSLWSSCRNSRLLLAASKRSRATIVAGEWLWQRFIRSPVRRRGTLERRYRALRSSKRLLRCARRAVHGVLARVLVSSEGRLARVSDELCAVGLGRRGERVRALDDWFACCRGERFGRGLVGLA